ncbi:1,25-dihydroxyvitamin D(3) 24-hydroxylase, mitochondrial [Lampetra fluviatilis]
MNRVVLQRAAAQLPRGCPFAPQGSGSSSSRAAQAVAPVAVEAPASLARETWPPAAGGAASGLRSMSEMPSPPSLPVVGSLFEVLRKGGISKQYQVLTEYHQRLGSIYRMRLGSFESVHVGAPHLVESLFRREAACPHRLDIKPWKAYRDLRGEAYGLLILDDKPWQKMRRAFQKKLMLPEEVAKYDGKINEVLSDFVVHLDATRDAQGGIRDLCLELHKWSFETISYILYGKRFGLLSQDMGEEGQIFITSIKQMMATFGTMLVTPVGLHRSLNTRTWRVHTEAWDNIFRIAKQCVLTRLGNAQCPGQDLVSQVARGGVLSPKELYAGVAEMQIGGVETTAVTLMWAIFHLSRSPRAQKRLRGEMEALLPPGRAPSAAEMPSLRYLRACLKESMRLSPTIPFTSRTLSRETPIGEYLLPKDTVVMVSNHALAWSEDYFPNAMSFRPERWLEDPPGTVKPFSHIPFGFGPRMCIGRRLAELEIHLALATIVQTYNIVATDDGPITALHSGTMVPDRKIPVAFVRRRR